MFYISMNKVNKVIWSCLCYFFIEQKKNLLHFPSIMHIYSEDFFVEWFWQQFTIFYKISNDNLVIETYFWWLSMVKYTILPTNLHHCKYIFPTMLDHHKYLLCVFMTKYYILSTISYFNNSTCDDFTPL